MICNVYVYTFSCAVYLSTRDVEGPFKIAYSSALYVGQINQTTSTAAAATTTSIIILL